MKIKCFPLIVLCLFCARVSPGQQFRYTFQDPNLPIEERVNNILSLMTVQEKIAALSTNLSVPRLGIQGSSHIEGLHGVALGGPGGWEGHGLQPLPTTQFPQSVGLGETWDPQLVRKAAAVEGYEARYTFNTDTQYASGQRGGKYRRAGIVNTSAQCGPGTGSALGPKRRIFWGRFLSHRHDGNCLRPRSTRRQSQILAFGLVDEAFSCQ
jgi:hypothetical protein